MFRIDLQLEDKRLTGLDALDERRRLKLPDGVKLETTERRTEWYPVSEGFARKHFGRTETEMTRIVPLGILTPDDVVLSSINVDFVKLSPALTAERAMELFACGESAED